MSSFLVGPSCTPCCGRVDQARQVHRLARSCAAVVNKKCAWRNSTRMSVTHHRWLEKSNELQNLGRQTCRQELLICGTIQDLNILWQQSITLSRNELTNWSLTIWWRNWTGWERLVAEIEPGFLDCWSCHSNWNSLKNASRVWCLCWYEHCESVG